MVENLDSITAYCCGTCSMVFTTEDELREHLDIPDEDGERHDGKPSMIARLSIGQRLTWKLPGQWAGEKIEITRIVRNEDGEVWIHSKDSRCELPTPLDWFVVITRAYEDSNHGS